MRTGSTPWNQSWIAVALAAVLLPPAGLLLVWKRSDLRVSRKLWSTVAIAALAVAHLFLFWGLRVQLDGSASRPIFSFGNRETHYDAIERDREADREAPVPADETPEAAIIEPEAVTGEREPEVVPPDAYWTGFRGPDRDGRYDEMPILTDWPSEGLPELWRKPVGGGFASFSIANGKAYTIEQRRGEEVVGAYDMETGREVWTNSWEARFEDSMGGPGPRATPTWSHGRIYALGATGELRALDAETGSVLWSKNILSDTGSSNTTWGIAASPLAVDGMVVVMTGGATGPCAAAYNAETGERVWTSLDDRGAYTSAMVVTLAGLRQLLVVTGERIAGLRVADGGLLWDYPWVTDNDVNASQPLVVDENRIFVSAGYGHGAVLLEISGQDGHYTASRIWQTNRMKNKFNASVVYEGYVYGLDEGILACVGLDDGELRWKGGRYGFGQVLLASGHLVVVTERGELVLVKPSPEGHQELARFRAIQGRTWHSPAIAGGKLLVRNEREAACYGIAP